MHMDWERHWADKNMSTERWEKWNESKRHKTQNIYIKDVQNVQYIKRIYSCVYRKLMKIDRVSSLVCDCLCGWMMHTFSSSTLFFLSLSFFAFSIFNCLDWIIPQFESQFVSICWFFFLLVRSSFSFAINHWESKKTRRQQGDVEQEKE